MSVDLINKFRTLMALGFAMMFLMLSLALSGLAFYQLFDQTLAPEGDLISPIIKFINTFVIALAMFELGSGVSKEYSAPDDGENIYFNIRRTITRFVGTACIALVLEALIMAIKYSQLEMAGNIPYPVSILFGASILLVSLGTFLWLTKGHTE